MNFCAISHDVESLTWVELGKGGHVNAYLIEIREHTFLSHVSPLAFDAARCGWCGCDRCERQWAHGCPHWGKQRGRGWCECQWNGGCCASQCLKPGLFRHRYTHTNTQTHKYTNTQTNPSNTTQQCNKYMFLSRWWGEYQEKKNRIGRMLKVLDGGRVVFVVSPTYITWLFF